MGSIPVGDSDFSLSFVRDMTNFAFFGQQIVTMVTIVFLGAPRDLRGILFVIVHISYCLNVLDREHHSETTVTT